MLVMIFSSLIYISFGLFFFREKASIFGRVFQWLAYCLIMACKMSKIQKLTISCIPWFVDMHMDALSPNMASGLPG